MNRMFALFLAFALIICFAGCQAPAPQSAPAPAEVKVTTIDELLNALGSNKTIQLEPGIYDLSQAASYGQADTGESYRWVEVFDGYELELTAIQNLVITGAEREAVTICTDPRNAAVIALDNCSDVTLCGFTAGHNYYGQACEGPVVRLQSCLGTEFTNVGLYGCGAIGVEARQCREFRLRDCEIYDCSSDGIYLYECVDATVVNTDFRDIGKDGLGWTVIGSSDSSKITFSRCTVRNCQTYDYLNTWNCSDFTVEDTVFADNTLREAAMNLTASQVILKDNIFADTPVRWYIPGSDYAVDAETGEAFQADEPELSHEASGPAQAQSVTTGKQKTVKAATVDEFLAAIGSDTEIVLTRQIYDLTTAADYGTTGGKYYYWEDCYDGPQLVIKGVENMTVRGGGRDSCTITTDPRYANVLNFKSCANVELTGFTAGHTKEAGSCVGGVIWLYGSRDILVNECGLFGCGVLGVNGENCQSLQIINTDIYECSYGGIQLQTCDGCTVGGCSFRDLGGAPFQFYDVANAVIEGDCVDNYYYGS